MPLAMQNTVGETHFPGICEPFSTKRCHFVKFPTIAQTVAQEAILFWVEVSCAFWEMKQCCVSMLPFCMFVTEDHMCYKHAVNTSLKGLLSIPSLWLYTLFYLHILGFGLLKILKLKCHTTEVCVCLLTDISSAFVAPWPQRTVASIFIELTFNPTQRRR